ncbi:hypothetical protein EG329_005357 [Mollisiaceae sp. DMI_Dod_QoI]|nr:hypothetical protein EG329_005357 [Helotiales sp. DMI_Dod_QoI]
MQKSLSNQFTQITGTPEKTALRYLKASNWKLDAAVNSYFGSNDTAPVAKDRDAIGKLFEKYHASTDDKDLTGVEGTMTYLNDLGVNLENAEMLVPLEIIQAPSLGEMSKQGFIDGWSAVGADTLGKQKSYVAGQIKNLRSDIALFKRVYRHTFICAKDKGQKALPLENALVYWELLFSSPGKSWVTPSTNWADLWMEFLKAKWTKSVNKDMWNQTFVFFEKTMEDESLSFWSEDGAWPGVIDDFVVYAKEKRGDVPDTMETD